MTSLDLFCLAKSGEEWRDRMVYWNLRRRGAEIQLIQNRMEEYPFSPKEKIFEEMLTDMISPSKSIIRMCLIRLKYIVLVHDNRPQSYYREHDTL